MTGDEDTDDSSSAGGGRTGGDREHGDRAGGDRADGEELPPESGEDVASASTEPDETDQLREELDRLREELESFEDRVDDRTLHRDAVESDLRRYVRKRLRSGHARGWGPYLVLLYGTIMTIAVVYTPYLGGGWAIFAMIVIWLSTLGLYVLMVLFGVAFNLLDAPGKLLDLVGSLRS